MKKKERKRKEIMEQEKKKKWRNCDDLITLLAFFPLIHMTGQKQQQDTI